MIEKPSTKDQEEAAKHVRIGNTTYEVISFYAGKVSLPDLIKNAIKREIEAKTEK